MKTSVLHAAVVLLATSGAALAHGSQTGALSGKMDADMVRQAQERLDQLGMNAGSADGVIGPQTRQAIRQFQQSHGLQVTGSLDNNTLNQLGVTETSTGSSGVPANPAAGAQTTTIPQSSGSGETMQK